MPVERFGEALVRFQKEYGVDSASLALKMGWAAGPNPLSRYKRDNRKPRIETIDRLSEVMRLNYEDRLYLYGLAGYLPAYPIPSVEEIQRNLERLTILHQSTIPILIIDYEFRVWKSNDRVAILTGRREEELQILIDNRFTLFDIVFNPSLGFRAQISNWQMTALDIVRDFISFNILRRHEAFYQNFPEKFAHLSDFLEVWQAAQIDPYIKLIENRSMGRNYRPIGIRQSADEHTAIYYLSRHNIPILNNLFRMLRFMPQNDRAIKLFPPPVPKNF